jgi:hypothetical protein
MSDIIDKANEKLKAVFKHGSINIMTFDDIKNALEHAESLERRLENAFTGEIEDTGMGTCYDKNVVVATTQKGRDYIDKNESKRVLILPVEGEK